jgi:cell division protein FtsB
MTVLGKILTFLVLILALAQLALHVMFHVSQTNWKKGYDQLNRQYAVLQSDLDTYQKERDAAREEKDKAVQLVQADLDKVNAQLATEKKNVTDRDSQLAAQKAQLRQADAGLAGSGIDVTRRQDEVAQMESQYKVLNDRNKELVDNNNKLRDRAVAAEIEARGTKERNGVLVTQLEDMSKELIKLKNGGGASSVGGTLTAKNPPPEDVEGQVMKTDAGGLVTISRGSDDGLTKGNTLEVFRLSPPKYLGMIRLIQVAPHEAVGQFVKQPLGQVQQGDKVASKILGGG